MGSGAVSCGENLSSQSSVSPYARSYANDLQGAPIFQSLDPRYSSTIVTILGQMEETQ